MGLEHTSKPAFIWTGVIYPQHLARGILLQALALQTPCGLSTSGQAVQFALLYRNYLLVHDCLTQWDWTLLAAGGKNDIFNFTNLKLIFSVSTNYEQGPKPQY